MKTKIESNKAPAAIGPYSQAIKVEKMLFISGQLPINRQTGAMPDGIKEQTKQSLDNIGYILEEAGLNMKNIVKTTVYLQHLSDFNEMNEIYASYFDDKAPARACFEVVALPKAALVEIEAIACED